MHARSIGPYSLITQQALGGKAEVDIELLRQVKENESSFDSLATDELNIHDKDANVFKPSVQKKQSPNLGKPN